MRFFAELAASGSGLEENVVRCVWEQEDSLPLPVYAPNTVMAVEVTNHNPLPEHGWLFDPSGGMFSPPSVEPPLENNVEPPLEN